MAFPYSCYVQGRSDFPLFSGRSCTAKTRFAQSCLQFPVAVNNWRVSFGSFTKPHARVLPAPHAFVFQKNRCFSEVLSFDSPPHVTGPYEIKTDHLKESRLLLRKLLRGDNSSEVALLVLDGFRAIGRGLDERNFENSFLIHWQVLEMLMCNSKEQATNEKVKRVGLTLWKIMNTNDLRASDLLHICCEARNDLVHRGIFEHDGEYAVQALREVVASCLLAVDKLRDYCQTREEIRNPL